MKPPSGGGFRLAEEELQIGAVAATFRGLGGAGEKVEKPGENVGKGGGSGKNGKNRAKKLEEMLNSGKQVGNGRKPLFFTMTNG